MVRANNGSYDGLNALSCDSNGRESICVAVTSSYLVLKCTTIPSLRLTISSAINMYETFRTL